jgi:hypothetical protein
LRFACAGTCAILLLHITSCGSKKKMGGYWAALLYCAFLCAHECCP